MKKIYKVLALILVCAMILAACGGTASSQAESSAEPEKEASKEETAPAEESKEESKEEAPAESAEPIYCALVGPMTGDNAQYGQQFQRGIETFIEEYNAAGGFHGRMLELTAFDDKNDAKEAVNVANKIASEEKYSVVFGPYSSTCAFAMAEVLDEAKIIQISPCVSHPAYVSYKYTVRIGHVNTEEGKYVAKYMKRELGCEKVAGIWMNTDWGVAVNEAWSGFCGDEGLELVSDDSYIAGQTKDFTPLITKIKELNPDGLYLMGNYAEVGPMLQQIKDMQLEAHVIVGTPSYKQETLDLAGEAAQGVDFITAFTVDNPAEKVVAFRQLMREKYDVEIDNFIVRAYDAVDVYTRALEADGGSTDADEIIAVIPSLQNIEGVSGTFSYQPDRNTTRSFLINQDDGTGHFKFVKAPQFD